MSNPSKIPKELLEVMSFHIIHWFGTRAKLTRLSQGTPLPHTLLLYNKNIPG
jgi:hypothetical protein